MIRSFLAFIEPILLSMGKLISLIISADLKDIESPNLKELKEKMVKKLTFKIIDSLFSYQFLLSYFICINITSQSNKKSKFK